MVKKMSTLQVRVDDEVKEQAKKVLADYGVSMSVAVGLLLHRIVEDKALPFEIKVPNAQTRAAMEESRQIMAERKLRFATADALFADLEKDGTK